MQLLWSVTIKAYVRRSILVMGPAWCTPCICLFRMESHAVGNPHWHQRPHYMPSAPQVLPAAVHRGGRGFADNWRAGQIQPQPAPLDTLFDVDHLVEWAARRNTVLHVVLSASVSTTN